MLAPSGFPCGGRSALRRLLLPQLYLDLALLVEVAVHRDSASSILSVAVVLFSLSSEGPSNQVPDPRSLSEPFPSTFLPQFSPFPSFSAYSQGKDFLLVLQGRWALLYLPCQDHSSPLAQLSSQCCPGEVPSSPRYS